MHKTVNTIGQDRAVQNPMDAVAKEHGTYRDNVEGMTPAQKYANLAMPAAPDPSPFANLSKSVGPGRGGQ